MDSASYVQGGTIGQKIVPTLPTSSVHVESDIFQNPAASNHLLTAPWLCRTVLG